MALNTHGTRAVQKLIETLTTREQVILTSAVATTVDSVRLHWKNPCTNWPRLRGFRLHVLWKPSLSRTSSACDTSHGPGTGPLPWCAQVSLVTDALEEGVVSLIRDLNGNHVIQRCLQRLGPEESQFVYDAAAANTMDIATHRHGCCVLQRCIDFATPAQKRRVVDKISEHALPLSQVSSPAPCYAFHCESPLRGAG